MGILRHHHGHDGKAFGYFTFYQTYALSGNCHPIITRASGIIALAVYGYHGYWSRHCENPLR